jgi:hypothetical protein
MKIIKYNYKYLKMGEMLLVACVYSPFAILFGVLAYYWNFLHKLKKTDDEI